MKHLIQNFISNAEKTILGKNFEIKLALACFMAKGHLLIEDVPGMGKTTFAKVFSGLLGLDFSRVQFTNDLMPSDLIGLQIYNQAENRFTIVEGPLFSQFILADELNRGTPKTQSALLEAMEEGQITLDGQTKKLPSPFFVVATQNPRTQIGTHHLPESQLDRFCMKIKLGYPDPNYEKQILTGKHNPNPSLNPVFTVDELQKLQQMALDINVSENLLQYMLNLLSLSRSDSQYLGLSPRAGKDVISCAKAWALIDGRDYVIPDDIKAVFPYVTSHRLTNNQGQPFDQDLLRAKKVLTEVRIDN